MIQAQVVNYSLLRLFPILVYQPRLSPFCCLANPASCLPAFAQPSTAMAAVGANNNAANSFHGNGIMTPTTTTAGQGAVDKLYAAANNHMMSQYNPMMVIRCSRLRVNLSFPSSNAYTFNCLPCYC